MKSKVPVKLLASVFSLLFVLPLLIKSSGVSAEVEITKVSALTGRAFFGDNISATYYKGSAPYSITFSYFDSFSSPGVGLNVDSSSIIPTPLGMAQYDFVVYKASIPNDWSAFVDSVSFNDFYLRFGDYARGGFALSCRLSDGIQSAVNNAVSYPNNYCGSFGGVRADSSASASLADYYGTMYFSPASGMTTLNFRPIYYNFDNGGIMESLEFQSIPCYTDNYGTVLYFIIICPYIGSSMSGEPSAETTTATTSPSSNIDVNVSVYVDNSGIESQLNEYLGADDTRITTYETINLGTFPTFNYDNVTETVNISQVVSETGDGINSIWYLISGLFSSVPVLVWLVPFCIFMSIMSFVLWRKGG